MRKVISILLMALMLMTTCPAIAETTPEAAGYYLISEVWIYEPRVTAIAIEFDKPLACAFDLTKSFSVSAELKELTSYEGVAVPGSSWPMSPRNIVAAYTSDEPVVGKICAGNFVILELSDTDSNAASTYISLKRVTLEGGAEKGWNNGREILPYGENMVYDIELLYSLKYADGTFTSADVAFERRGEWTDVADDFIPGKYVSENTSITVNVNGEEKSINSIGYTMYSPVAPVEGEKYPLVVYLHGSSCRSIYEEGIDDVMTPVLTNQGGVTWVENGDENCYVLVPQYESVTFPLVKELIASVLADESLAIDMSRVYVSGLSMGGMSSWELLTDEDFAHYFAAALINCGYPTELYPSFDGASSKSAPSEEYIAAIRKAVANGTQIWLVHSDTDPTVPVEGSFYGFKAAAGLAMDEPMPEPVSDDEYLTYWEALDGQVRFTEVHFIPGRRNINFNMYSESAHEVYEYSYSVPYFVDWVFDQSK